MERRANFKRKKSKRSPSLEQTLEALAASLLQGVLDGSTVWLAVSEDCASRLNDACFGQVDGGPATCEWTRSALAAANPSVLCQDGQPHVSVRLSLQEAFFLVHALHILTLNARLNSNWHQLNSETLWAYCTQHQTNFVPLYVAMYHFRSKGWMPRSGLQYGVDYVLYQKHPAVAHSDFCVLVLPAGAAANLSWHDIEATNRLSVQVGKRLLLFYVDEPPNVDHNDLSCMESIVVEERLVSRWVPEAERNAVLVGSQLSQQLTA